MSTVCLVACVHTKRPYACAAKDLYCSPLLLKARQWAESHADAWYILSAKWGLVLPGDIVTPYNETLSGAPVASRREWAARVLPELLKVVQSGDRVVFLAGRAYRDGLTDGLLRRGCFVEAPMEGLGIGKQLQWLDRNR